MDPSISIEQNVDSDHESTVPATPDETRAYLLNRSNRSQVPIAKTFVQKPRGSGPRVGPLAQFVTNGDLRGLKALLFFHAIISNGTNGWDTRLHLATIARALSTTETASPRSAASATSRILTRLEDRKLIERARTGQDRKITITLLRPDGTGRPYTRPKGADTEDRFLRLDHAYWTAGHHETLDLPALAMLLVALHEKPNFELPTEHMPDWYGWSADTAERGLKSLEKLHLINVTKRQRKHPLAPTGLTTKNVYRLHPPFDSAYRPTTTTGPST